MSILKSPPCWSEVTAVFGGRFDPPHLGHREAVKGLFKTPGIKRVLIVPSACPPHKSTWAKAEQRAEMARLNFSSTAQDPYPFEVEIDLRELGRAAKKPATPSYSFDTLKELQPLYEKLAFVIGSDQLEQLSQWHRFPELLSLCNWIALERKPEGETKALQTLSQWETSGLVKATSSSRLWEIKRESGNYNVKSKSYFIHLVPTEARSVSSTQIREGIARTGNPPENSLTPDVLSYLKVQRLYGI